MHACGIRWASALRVCSVMTPAAVTIKFATRMTQRDAAALTIALLHWQIPGQRSLVSYLWDTRAILLMPAWRRGKNDGNLRWYAQAGPSVSLMIEGPDEGFRGGANAELVGSVRLGALPSADRWHRLDLDRSGRFGLLG